MTHLPPAIARVVEELKPEPDDRVVSNPKVSAAGDEAHEAALASFGLLGEATTTDDLLAAL